MGLLDEAIREHLQLKRDHGVGEEELRQQEHEALGPARREAPAEAEAEEAVADEPLPDAELAPEADAEPFPEEGEHLGEPEEPAAEQESEPRIPSGDTPTHGFPAIDEDEERPDAEGEDVLEETPEFLQETPEHDRLWFEQKPPRDFDFE